MLYRRKPASKKQRMRAKRKYAVFLKNQLRAISMNTNLFKQYRTLGSNSDSQNIINMLYGAMRAPRLSQENVGSLYEMAQNALNTSSSCVVSEVLTMV